MFCNRDHVLIANGSGMQALVILFIKVFGLGNYHAFTEFNFHRDFGFPLLFFPIVVVMM